MPSVISFSEDSALAKELVTAAKEISRSLGAESFAVELDEPDPALSAGEIIVLKAESEIAGDADAVATAIAELARARDLAILLVGETRFGIVVAAKIAARLRIGSLGKGKNLRASGGVLLATRDVYGGRFLAEVGARLPCVALVQPGAYSPGEGAPGHVETVDVKKGEAKVTIVETRKAHQSDEGIKTAQRIVAAGRGFAKKEDLALARDLAAALGAALGSSRPLSSDLGWVGEEQHIGLTGAYVHPKLYVAIGISGQLQHVAGIKDSKVIVAINKDRQAPIFQFADYGIVGDLYEVVPLLTKALKVG